MGHAHALCGLQPNIFFSASKGNQHSGVQVDSEDKPELWSVGVRRGNTAATNKVTPHQVENLTWGWAGGLSLASCSV